MTNNFNYAKFRNEGDLITHAQRKVLTYLVHGDSNDKIAQKLQLNVKTVKFHIGRINKIFKVKQRSELIVAYWETKVLFGQITDDLMMQTARNRFTLGVEQL